MGQMQERRNDARLLCADLIELIWKDYSGQERRRIANLEDISSCGMSLQLEMFVRVGTRIRVLCAGQKELFGVVRYSQYRNRAYFLGVEFDEDCRWSAKEFLPQHLMDPRQVLQRPPGAKLSAGNSWIN